MHTETHTVYHTPRTLSFSCAFNTIFQQQEMNELSQGLICSDSSIQLNMITVCHNLRNSTISRNHGGPSDSRNPENVTWLKSSQKTTKCLLTHTRCQMNNTENIYRCFLLKNIQQEKAKGNKTVYTFFWDCLQLKELNI